MRLLLLLLFAGCADREPAWSEAWLDAQAARYLDDDGFRRKALEASLENHNNTYSRQRLEAYGLVDRGWDRLPEWNPRSRPVAQGEVGSFTVGESPLWDGARPKTLAEWVALGHEVFFGYPLRAEVFMEYALGDQALLTAVGVQKAPDGTWPGLRAFVDVDGQTRVGITCALCHSSLRDGALVVGAANRAFDYGRLRLTYHQRTGVPVDAELARRMATWGPGRADVTEDDDQDPVAIPDLWGLREQSALTQAGSIRHVGPAALAIRQETQLLHANHQRIRPPRELSWALAMYLYSLSPLAKPAIDTGQGAQLFADHCRRCHSNAALGGELVAAERVGTDGALAHGAARGTGRYRPPALLDVKNAAPYFHHGAVPTLADVLSPERLQPTYDKSPLGPGAVPGHSFGTDLSPEDRAALQQFLERL